MNESPVEPRVGWAATRVRLATVVLAASLAGIGAVLLMQRTPADDWVVSEHCLLTVDRRMNLESLAAAGAKTVRITVSGTFSSTIDHSELDAVGWSRNGVRDLSSPGLHVPPGSRVLARDSIAHRYTLEVSLAVGSQIYVNYDPIAEHNWVSFGEARRSLNGAYFVDVLEPAPPPANDATVEALVAALLGLAVLAALSLLVSALVARSRLPEHVLARRARGAASRALAEAAALGPAFVRVAVSVRALVDRAEDARAAVTLARQRLESTRSVHGASAEHWRAEIADLLDTTHACLAAHRADAQDTWSTAAGALCDEVDDALAADAETRAL